MALDTIFAALAEEIGNEHKALRMLINGNVVDLDALTTTAKANLVEALNEVRELAIANDATIDDETVSTDSTYSSAKIVATIDEAITAVIGNPTVDLVAIYRAALA